MLRPGVLDDYTRSYHLSLTNAGEGNAPASEPAHQKQFML